MCHSKKERRPWNVGPEHTTETGSASNQIRIGQGRSSRNKARLGCLLGVPVFAFLDEGECECDFVTRAPPVAPGFPYYIFRHYLTLEGYSRRERQEKIVFVFDSKQDLKISA